MEKLKRILGLDVGDKRIGVAVSYELGLTAQPVMTLERQSLEKDCAALNALIQKYEISKIVVGIPRSLSMKITPQTQKVLDLVEIFKQKWSLPIEEWNEWYSTQSAQAVLIEANMSRKKRKQVIDKLAAVLILQGYLDSQS